MKFLRKFKREVGILTLILAVFLILPAVQAQEIEIIEELKLFSRALGAILEGYVEPLDGRKLFYAAVKGMVGMLDQYSQFFDLESYELLKIDMKGEYSGIGAKLTITDQIPVVDGIKPGSAAEKAGLKLQDMILMVNKDWVVSKPVETVSALMRGDEGTKLDITVWREIENKLLEFSIFREKIEITSVNDVRMVGRAIGYIRIDDFSENTVTQFDLALTSLRGKGMRALIVDLRGNDGGLMPIAVELAERFLPQGAEIVSVESRIEVQTKKFISSGKKTEPNYPLVVLVNQATASASEIFSAAIKDNGRGTIIGMKTFGKASVQSVVPLDETTAVKFTTARYHSPKGGIIDGVGIVPDQVVENEVVNGQVSDRQVRAALDRLKEFL